MTKYLLPLVLLLAGCATVLDHSTQKINFQTVGATEADCMVEIDGKYRYNVKTPQTVTIQKSRRDMLVTCRAAGNRFKKMVVTSTISGWTAANVSNGLVPGALYDAETGAMFSYPDIVIVDFTNTVATPDALPGYFAADTLDPAHAGIEDFGPDVAKIATDDATALKHKMARMKHEREQSAAQAVEEERTVRKEALEGGWDGDGKGGAAYVPPAYVPPGEPDDSSSITLPPPNPAPAPDNAPGGNPGRNMPTPLFPATTSF